jgi:hypothetical protein
MNANKRVGPFFLRGHLRLFFLPRVPAVSVGAKCNLPWDVLNLAVLTAAFQAAFTLWSIKCGYGRSSASALPWVVLGTFKRPASFALTGGT